MAVMIMVGRMPAAKKRRYGLFDEAYFQNVSGEWS
jgi:hypothetical protein